MATPTSGSGNLVDEFEEAFQSCLNVLTKEEAVPSTDKDEIRSEVDQTILRFIDLARQMEAFFLQKRFLLSALKPELVVKEDIAELRMELVRKEELLKRHYDKIAVWQNLLSDLQGYAKSPAQGTSTSGVLSNGSSVPQSPISSQMNGGQVSQTQIGSIAPQMAQQIVAQQQAAQMQQVQMQQVQMQQAQQQAQLQQMQQAQQAQMQLQQQMQVPPGLAGGAPTPTSLQQAMFLQQQQSMGRGFPQAGPGGVLQGPLAFLEKTTSNIGMGDGRR